MSKFYKNKEYTRRTGSSTLQETIKELLDFYKLTPKFNETQAINSWEKIMGKPIAQRTGRLYIKNKVLYVEITSPPLKHQLAMGKSKIIALLNEEVGSEVIEEVVFM